MIRVNVSNQEALALFICKEIEEHKVNVQSNRRFQDKLN